MFHSKGWTFVVAALARVLPVLLSAALLLSPVAAQFTFLQEGPKLVGSGAVGGATQGQSVALSDDGNTAIVGGLFDNGNAGAAWIFTRSAGVWTEQVPSLSALAPWRLDTKASYLPCPATATRLSEVAKFLPA